MTRPAVVLARNGEVAIVDEKGRELEKYEVPTGAIIKVAENEPVKTATGALRMGPAQYSRFSPRRAGGSASKTSSMARRCGLRAGSQWRHAYVITEHKGDLHPQIVVEDPQDGKILDFYYMPERAHPGSPTKVT